jgi:hypothetical protein
MVLYLDAEGCEICIEARLQSLIDYFSSDTFETFRCIHGPLKDVEEKCCICIFDLSLYALNSHIALRSGCAIGLSEYLSIITISIIDINNTELKEELAKTNTIIFKKEDLPLIMVYLRSVLPQFQRKMNEPINNIDRYELRKTVRV